MRENRTWSVIEGYEAVSAYYDEWYWQSFWMANERPLIIREIMSLASNITSAADVGTGTGLYLSDLSRLDIACVGVDASQAMLREARKRLPNNANLIHASIERLPFPNGVFDLVIACRVLSHVSNLDVAMRELGRVTSAGGVLVISDVSAHHNYTSTRIPTPEGDVHIETYKHTEDQLTEAAEDSRCWRADHVSSVAYKDLLWKPQPSEYPAIDVSSVRPIFLYALFTRIE